MPTAIAFLAGLLYFGVVLGSVAFVFLLATKMYGTGLGSHLGFWEWCQWWGSSYCSS